MKDRFDGVDTLRVCRGMRGYRSYALIDRTQFGIEIRYATERSRRHLACDEIEPGFYELDIGFEPPARIGISDSQNTHSPVPRTPLFKPCVPVHRMRTSSFKEGRSSRDSDS